MCLEDLELLDIEVLFFSLFSTRTSICVKLSVHHHDYLDVCKLWKALYELKQASHDKF